AGGEPGTGGGGPASDAVRSESRVVACRGAAGVPAVRSNAARAGAYRRGEAPGRGRRADPRGIAAAGAACHRSACTGEVAPGLRVLHRLPLVALDIGAAAPE